MLLNRQLIETFGGVNLRIQGIITPLSAETQSASRNNLGDWELEEQLTLIKP